MTETLVIARRELEEKRFVFVAAIAFAIISVLLPLVPGIHGDARAIIVTTSILLAVAFTIGLAGILGGSIVGRDIAAGRMSFYFARPVGGAAIWFGKLLAAVLLILVSYTIIALPALITGVHSIRGVWGSTNEQAVAIFFGSAAAIFFATHAVGTMIRSRSALIALDFIAGGACGFLAWMIVRPLLEGAALDALRVLAWGAGVAALVAFIAAGAWQLIDGRTDRRRSHAAFSKAFWIVTAVALAMGAAFSAWIVSVTPAALGTTVFAEASSGSTALITGVAAHRFDYQPLFLYDVATGHAERLGGTAHWRGTLTRDGNRFIAIDASGITRTNDAGEVYVRDTKAGAPFVGTSLKISASDAIAATDDGARIAVAHDGVLTVYEVAQRKSLGSVRVGDTPIVWMFFTTPDVVRLYASDARTYPVVVREHFIASRDYDIASHALRGGGAMHVTGRFVYLFANADGSQVVVHADRTAQLCDGRTLQPIAMLPPHHMTTFLADGRLALAGVDGHRGRLTIASPAGAVMNTIDLGPATATYYAGEAAPGMIAVSMAEGPMGSHLRTMVVDANRAAIVRSEPDLRAIVAWYVGGHGDARQPKSAPMRLMVDTKGEVAVRWNAVTGERAAV